MFRYNEAILTRIPDTLLTPTSDTANGEGGKKKKKEKKKKKGKENAEDEPLTSRVDLNKCKKEFENLVTVLREIGLDVVELPPDNTCPMSSFVGDTAFVLNGTGLVTKPKDNGRKTEITTIKTILTKELDNPVVEVTEEGAHIEGADILFTGRELFVGISNYTNESGARFVASTFPEYPCSPIKVPGEFHLTHYVNMASPDIICVGGGKESQDIIKRMEREASFRYQTITMPEDLAATVLFVNGTLVHLSTKEIPESYKVFSDKLALPRRTVELSELSKVSANFARLMVLLKKPKKKPGIYSH